MRPSALLALAAVACAAPAAKGPEAAARLPPDTFDDGTLGACDPTCPGGAFCSTHGLCASAGPVACPLPCASGQSCGPFQPGCLPDGCVVDPGWPVDVQKAISLVIAPSDVGCDLDGNGTVDNALGGVARLVPGIQDRLRESVETAQSVAMLHRRGSSVSVWFGALAPGSQRCNPASSRAFCAYTASPWSFDTAGERATCGTWWTMHGAAEAGGRLAAGLDAPSESLVPFDDTSVLLRLARPRLAARIVPGLEGGDRLVDGVLCAAVVPAQLRLALAALPASVLDGVGGLGQAQWFFDTLVHPDLDLDGNDLPDHVSVALRFETTPALVTGLSR
jgi:hypothetical protein